MIYQSFDALLLNEHLGLGARLHEGFMAMGSRLNVNHELCAFRKCMIASKKERAPIHSRASHFSQSLYGPNKLYAKRRSMRSGVKIRDPPENLNQAQQEDNSAMTASIERSILLVSRREMIIHVLQNHVQAVYSCC